MRKYYQAILAMTAIMSLIALLIYRHEYNKLRYVLEVFNYFGKIGPRDTDANCTYFNLKPHTNILNMKFDEPIPSWQRLEDDLYVYSAYGIKNHKHNEIRAVGLGTINSVSNIQCLVFFEGEAKPMLGHFKFVPIGKLSLNMETYSGYRGYHFICSYMRNKMPTGVTFVTKSNKYLNYAPILPVKVQPEDINNRRIGVCVMQSSMKQMQPIEMIGFIGFHALMQMNNFIIYDTGIPNEFNSRLKELSNIFTFLPTFSYNVIPWNFPFMEIDQNIIREIAEMDCLYRTFNNVAYAIFLSWDEYVVMGYHRMTINFMMDVKRTEYISIDRLKLKVTTFCTQQADNEQYTNSTLTILKKTKASNVHEDRSVYIYQPHTILQAHLQNFHTIHTKDIPRRLIGINQYKHCDNNMENGVEDGMILRFAQDMDNLWILKKYREFWDKL